MKKPKLVFLQDKKLQWYWHVLSANGRNKLDRGCEGHPSLSNAKRNFWNATASRFLLMGSTAQETGSNVKTCLQLVANTGCKIDVIPYKKSK